MLIQNVKPYYFNNAYVQKTQHNEQTAVQNRNNHTSSECNYHILKVNELSSLFNISFGISEDKKLDRFCKRMEAKIIDMVTPKDEKIAEDALTPEFIDKISNVLKKDAINGRMYGIWMSVSEMMSYLKAKNQIQTNGYNKACFIDERAVDYLQRCGSEELLKDAAEQNIKFYCLETNKEKTDKIIKDFNDLTNNSFNVNRIKKPKNSNYAKYPDTAKIKKIITIYAADLFPNDKEKQNKYIDIICRYMDKNFIAFSYASLAENLKEIYKKIEKYVQKQGKTMEDVIYINEEYDKSNNLINYLYAQTNNAASDKFKTKIESSFDNSKIYVVLDDICISGQSMNHYLDDFEDAGISGNNIIIAPIAGSIAAGQYFKNDFDKKIQYMPAVRYYTLSDIEEKLAGEAENGSKKNFQGLNIDDINFLKSCPEDEIGTKALVCFPYMIPDYSMPINALLGGYFLNNDCLQANKAIESSWSESGVISEEKYSDLKRKIEA